MRSQALPIGSALGLLLSTSLGLALLPGCGGGAPSAEVQQANIQGELDSEKNTPNPEGTKKQRPGARNPAISVE